MTTETANPKAPGRATLGSEFANLAGCSSELTTPELAINRLRARFALSEPVASLVANLAGLGPKEARP